MFQLNQYVQYVKKGYALEHLKVIAIGSRHKDDPYTITMQHPRTARRRYCTPDGYELTKDKTWSFIPYDGVMIDFEVNDPVMSAHHRFGSYNGRVIHVDTRPVMLPIAVMFQGKKSPSYFTRDGRARSNSEHRILYHGHDLRIVVQEQLPINKERI